MNNDELKKKIMETLKNTVINYDCGHAIRAKNFYTERVFERFTDALIEAGIGDVKEVNCELTRIEVLKRERFAEEHGFTPDCTPYYIAEQYKHHAEVAERALDKATELAYEYRTEADTLSCSSCPMFEEIFPKCSERGLYVECSKRWKETLIEQAEKELSEEGKDE